MEVLFTAVVGIIAEFNPLHKGHKFIIDTAKQGGNTVVCVISGNFVQRGDTAVISKTKRAQAALICGADIVAELPVLWSMSTAQNFALGGVWQLYRLGCEEIIFGSESGDLQRLEAIAELLCSDRFSVELEKHIQKGITFASAREAAAIALGADPLTLRGANDNLGIEYIVAAKKLGIPMKFRCVKRLGARHDSQDSDTPFVSSSFIREKIRSGNLGFAEKYMPIPMYGFINEDDVSDIKRLETAILAGLRAKSEQEFKKLPDLSEGLDNKIYFSSRLATNLDELYNMIKTKRYTLARVRRLVLSAFLGFDNDFFMTKPPYVRILGFSAKGEETIKRLKYQLPIVTRVTQIKELDERCRAVFEAECRASDLYALSLSKPLPSGLEYKSKILKMECLQ